MTVPSTQYVKTEGGYVAYQVFGEGPVNFLFITNWCQNLEVMWEEPSIVRFFDHLSSMGRVICFDKRGSGVSDPVPLANLPTLEEWMDDGQAVINAAGADTVVLIGDTEGGAMTLLFAATYPHKVTSLILLNSFARFLRDKDYEIGLALGSEEKLMEAYSKNWGTAGFLQVTAPSMMHDQRFGQWFARYQRLSMSPGTSATLYRWVINLDLRGILPSIRVPTLVLQRASSPHYRAAFGKYLANAIAGAKYVELPGADTFPFYAGDIEIVLDEIQEFVTGDRAKANEERVLATLMFTDIVGSTQHAADLGDTRWGDLLKLHHTLVRRYLDQYHGKELQTTGDGFIAIFDGPARAIRCARTIADQVQSLKIDVRIGLHTGEISLNGKNAEGIAMHIAARVMAVAEKREVMVSRTVRDLVVGSGIVFTNRGVHQLKGVPDEWHLFSVSSI